MYGSDAGQPMPSLYTKGLSPLCDIVTTNVCVTVFFVSTKPAKGNIDVVNNVITTSVKSSEM